jgi:hypothetical protein
LVDLPVEQYDFGLFHLLRTALSTDFRQIYIELAGRGFVVLNIDAIGRGNSGIIGRWDEYRKRVTGMQDIEKE